MWQAEFKLYLYPVDLFYKTKPEVLISEFKELEFIGKQLSEERFATGNKFDSLLTFMGCSPNIELEPQEDSPYCYIEFGSADSPVFIEGKNTKYPSCPHCKIPLKAMDCYNCEEPIELEKLNWRKSAFFAKSWIEIGNIYELEAIPNDQLLDHLEKLTKIKWKPAYIRKTVSS